VIAADLGDAHAGLSQHERDRGWIEEPWWPPDHGSRSHGGL